VDLGVQNLWNLWNAAR